MTKLSHYLGFSFKKQILVQEAVVRYNHDPPCQDEINSVIRICSLRLNGSAGDAVGPDTVAAAHPRTAAQKEEFRKRLQTTREGGNPVGVADFTHWESGFEVR